MRLPRLSRSSENLSKDSLAPALTGFDFLDGAFRADERARVTGLLALGTTGLAMVLTALAGVTFGTQNTQVASQLAEANRQVSSLSVELGQLSNTGGLGDRELSMRLQELQSYLDSAGAEQVQSLTVINGLQAVIPPGARITSVELSRTDAGVQRLTAQVALQGFDSLTALSDGIATVWYLSSTDITWSSEGDRLAVTVKADIDPGLLGGPIPGLQAQVTAALPEEDFSEDGRIPGGGRMGRPGTDMPGSDGAESQDGEG